MKKRIISLIMLAAMTVCIFSAQSSALNGEIDKMPNGEPIYFTAANDVLQELKYNTMPIVRNNKIYIPYTLLTNNFNIISSYSESDKVLFLSNMRNIIRFDISSGVAYDLHQNKIEQSAILYKGQVFVPGEFITQYMGLSFAYIAEGPLVRIRDENFKYPDIYLGVLFKTRMTEMLNTFIKNLEADDHTDDPLPVNPKTIYLTFDDGPTDNTAQLIDILDKYNYNATFFLIGHHIPGNESTIRRLYIDGNSIGIHSYTHDKQLFYASKDAMLEEMEHSNSLIRRILQVQTRLTRLPYGSGESEFIPEYRAALRDAGYRYWDWTINSNSISENADTIYKNVTSQLEKSTRNAEVILFNDNEITVKALPKILDYLSRNKYIVKAISPLDNPINVRNEK